MLAIIGGRRGDRNREYVSGSRFAASGRVPYLVRVCMVRDRPSGVATGPDATWRR